MIAHDDMLFKIGPNDPSWIKPPTEPSAIIVAVVWSDYCYAQFLDGPAVGDVPFRRKPVKV